jgi:peptidoglycan/xylan/chitin deacetylase (PgdA/CDA1 family)
MRPISLLYHDVLSVDAPASGFPGADADAYKLDERNFKAHLESIAAAAGSRVQLIATVASPGDRPIFLTFDDGGASIETPIARLLEAQGWRGHFFVVTHKIDAPGFLTAQQIRGLHRRGHHIGSHSHTHPCQFSKLSYGAMLDEWRESRRILADILGEPPFSVSVPGGFYSAEVARAAREAGHRLLFNSEPSSRIRYHHGLLIIGRYGIKRNTTAEMAQALARGDLAPRARQALIWNMKKPLKKASGTAWFTFRRWFFRKHRDTKAQRHKENAA